jgi:Fe-S oxidoreductase
MSAMSPDPLVDDIVAAVLAAACPLCLKMLDDAVKAEGLGDRLAVRDLATLLLAAR